MGGGGERGPWTAPRALPLRALSGLLFASLLDMSESPCQLRLFHWPLSLGSAAFLV